VRAPGASPVTLPAAALGEALEIARLGTGIEAPARGLILYTGAAEWQQHSAQVEASRPLFDGVRVQLLTAGPLALLAQQLPAGSAINLLQGAYAPTSSRAVGFRAWRVAAILLACLVGLHVVGKAAELAVLKKREHSVDESIRATFHTAMPGDASAQDARRRMEQRLVATRGAGGGLLPALQALAQASASAPGTSLQALSFHAGALDMKLAAPDAASLDHLSQALRGSGWQADLTSGSNAASGYVGSIQLRGGS